MDSAAEPLLARVLSADAAGPDRTRTRILDAALEEFTRFGLRRVTMEDVAQRASIHRVTIYRRFDGKDALVDAVIMRELQRFLAAFTRAMAAVREDGEAG